MRLIDADALWKKLNEVGGCDAPKGSWAEGYDKAIDLAIRLVETALDITDEEQYKQEITDIADDAIRRTEACVDKYGTDIDAAIRAVASQVLGVPDAEAWIPASKPPEAPNGQGSATAGRKSRMK